MNRLFAVLALAVIPAAAVFAGDYGGESLLETGAGARGAAMGGALCAAADDSSAVFYNPAALVKLERQQVSVMHYPMMGGVLYNSATYGQPVLGVGYFGASFHRAGLQALDGYNELNEAEESYGYNEMKAGISYAREIVAGVSGGASLNIFNFSMADVNSYGFGFDIGILYEPFDGLALGLSVRNFMNPEFRLNTLSEQAARAFTAGAAYKISIGDFGVTAAADAVKNDDSGFRLKAGAEAHYAKIAAIRAGINDGEASFGAGVSVFDIGIDYAFTLNEASGGLSRFNLSYSFGLTLSQQEERNKEALREQVKKFIDDEFKKKERDRAREYFEAAAKFFEKGELEDASREIANALEWDKDYREARQLAEKISKSAAAAYLAEGKREYAARNFAAALEALRKSEDAGGGNEPKQLIERIKKEFLMPQGSSQFFVKGIEYYMNKQYNEAITEWQRALAADPDNATIKSYVARARKAIGSSAAAGRMSRQDEEKIRELYNEGLKKYTEGRLAQAVDTWGKILAINPQDIRTIKSIEKARAEIEELKKRGIK